MSDQAIILNDVTQSDYKYGFVTDIENETIPRGLNEEVIQEHLDTYRDWLHARSICPSCTANGYQISSHTYECPACLHTWRVNEARICALRRYSLTPSAR